MSRFSDIRDYVAGAFSGAGKYFTFSFWKGLRDDRVRSVILSSPKYKSEAVKFNRKLRKQIEDSARTQGRLEAALEKESSARITAESENALLKEANAGLESRVEEIGGQLEAATKNLRQRAQIQARQAKVTESLFSRLVMTERFATSHPSAIMFIDRDFRITEVSAGFTAEFGYDPQDLQVSLPGMDGLPFGDVSYDRAGIPASNILANPANFEKLRVLNESFYPKSRQTWHYDICLSVKPKQRERGFARRILDKMPWSEDPNIPARYMGNVTVAIDRGEFVGASVEFRRMSRAEVRKVGLSYIMNRDAFVTADAHITGELAEEYRKRMTALYTHDMLGRKRKKEDEFTSSMTIDFVNTGEIDYDALPVFREMYEFSQQFTTKAGDEMLKISFIHLSEELRSKLVAEGIPLKYLHLKPQKAVAQEKEAQRAEAPIYRGQLHPKALPETS